MSTIIQGVITSCAVIAFTVMAIIDGTGKREEKKPPKCLSCKKLAKYYKKRSAACFQFECQYYEGFDKPPDYCAYYERRKEADDGE